MARKPVRSPGRALIRWFKASARDMPWRTRPLGTPRNPYHVLVSELMLQQTQVARVAPAFERFIARFPTIASLAAASEPDVLALWSGLGYYRRAKLLHAAARAVITDHRGTIPPSAAALRELPGLGPYTAAAVASLAFHEPIAMVDGNVARVMLRLHGRRGSASDPKQIAWARERANELIEDAGRSPAPTLAAEALMELGATICTPRSPRCDACPLADACVARALVLTDTIPSPKPSKPTPTIHAVSILITDHRGRLAIETRPSRGMWASMTQAPTLEHADATPHGPRDPQDACTALGLPPSIMLREADRFDHQTTHRRFRFVVLASPKLTAPQSRAVAIAIERARPGVTWATRTEIAAMALSTVQSRVLLSTDR